MRRLCGDFYKLGLLFVGVDLISALLFRVFIGVLGFSKLPLGILTGFRKSTEHQVGACSGQILATCLQYSTWRSRVVITRPEL